MSPPAMMIELPRLFPLDDEEPVAGRSLEDVVMELLADADHGRCVVCEGPTHAVIGGARCEDCGTEVLLGEEPAPLWAA
jgi:hypothetical protein